MIQTGSYEPHANRAVELTHPTICVSTVPNEQ